MAKTKYILSIDGGGIRGIIPAMILAEIEKRTNKRITDIFYMLGGSSSGGLIVAGLNHNIAPRYSANQIVDIFRKHGPKIFANPGPTEKGPEYTHKYLKSVLNDYFKEEFLAATRRRVVLTSYDIFNNEPFMLDSWNHDARLVKVKDAVRATMAVPTLFLPKHLEAPKLDGTTYNHRVLVCGSLLANNPVAYALGSAYVWFPDEKYVVLSLGTGRTDMYMTSPDAQKLTKKNWVEPLRQISFSSCHGMNYLLSAALKSNFIRIDGSASSPASAIDDASEENIKALEQEAINTIKEHEKVIDKFCKSVAGYVGDDPEAKTTNYENEE